MKRLGTAVLTLLAMLVLHGCAHGPTQATRIPAKLDIPNDYKVTKAVWVDHERHRVGWPLGSSFLRGKTIKPISGVWPIHIMRADVPQFKGTPFKVDDLIIGLNGKPLGKDGEDDINLAVSTAKKNGKTITLTRWRKGDIKTFKLDFRVFDKGFIVPDLTTDGKPDETRDWTLGPLGVNGWGFSMQSKRGGSAKARQLLITLVDPEGPSKGKLEVGDVIVGAGGKSFTFDARKALAAAINEAEKVESKGKLKLLVWRRMKTATVSTIETFDVTITIPVLGTYGATAPFNCPKTEKIIDRAVAYMVKNKDTLLKPADHGWLNYINALGLMATGRDDVMPIVKELAHASLMKPGEKLSVDKHVSMMCWWWSYKTVFLSEYYLKTKDAAVLPTIKELANTIALGQSGAGTWGHTYAAKENTGYYHGHLGGYGAINQQGLTCMIALPLAVKCGIKDKEVMDAIKRGDDFFTFFIGKGTIPYGDHGAAPWYDDNGKSGSAAVFFDLMKKKKGCEFFSEMVLASSVGGREQGHTGHYWSHLWGGVGAARGGDKALQVYMNQMNPIFTLERQYNGRFAFQDNCGEKGHQGKPKAKWDCTGPRLLQLCVPRRALYITGKETPKKTHLTQQRIDRILKAGRLDIDKDARKKLTVPEILELLQDPLSPTRSMAARALVEREINCVDQLIKMLDSENKYARYGAAEALGKAGFASKKAADKIINMIATDEDTQFRIHAVGALISTDTRLGLSIHAKPAIPIMLRMVVSPAADDPRKVLQHDLSRALFYGGRAQKVKGLITRFGLEGVDRKLLIPAIKEILTNANGGARSMVTKSVYNRLTKEELELLWGDVYLASRYIAPSGIMFAPGARTDGLKLLGKHHVKEGMFLAAWYIRWQKGHGSARRVPDALAALEMYGARAKPMIPYLQEHAEYWISKRKKGRPIGPEDTANKILATIEKIKNSTEMPELMSIGKQIQKKDIPPKDGHIPSGQ